MKNIKKIILVLIIIVLALTLALSLRKKEESKNEITCFISVSCESLLDNLSKLSENKRSLVPENGFLLLKKEVTVNVGENVFNLLSETLKKEKIHIDFSKDSGGGAYIKGIGNLYEGDAGELSGWLYKVNNKVPSVGSNDYIINNGDEIKWIYSIDLLKDMAF